MEPAFAGMAIFFLFCVAKSIFLALSGERANGFVGYMQSTGDDPSDGQPLTTTKQPDFEDYGVGCVLLGGSELAKLAAR